MRYEVDDAFEIVLDADRQGHDQRRGREDVLDLLDDHKKVRADAVELVNKYDARNFGVIRITPVGLRLRLDAARATKYADATIEHLERTIHLDREVDVPRGINDVQSMIVPVAAGRGRLNRNAAFLFLLHEIRRCSAIVNLTDLVDLACEFKDALRGRGLARVNVGKNADISVLGQVCHVMSSVVVFSISWVFASTKPRTRALAGADRAVKQ